MGHAVFPGRAEGKGLAENDRRYGQERRTHEGRAATVCCCAQLCLTLREPWSRLSVSMEFSRQKYWSGLPFPPPGDLPNPGIEPTLGNLLCWQVDSLLLRHVLAESKSDPMTTLFRVFCYCCQKKKKISKTKNLNNLSSCS